ncbi:MAG: c-type cytochrome [Deltaproteobacteria bacterium]|nr:c-type cytochrome [Deltaproteobacteria bacterium]MBW2419689.1 c-type cytochrome [Deltaproteobacteria bacterium]
MSSRWILLATSLLVAPLLAPGGARADSHGPGAAELSTQALSAQALSSQAKAIFGPLPDVASAPNRPLSSPRVDLGRMLYYDARLSKNHDISCNSCHQLDNFGVDSEPTSPGHKGQRGGRNSPTSLNAALHVTQFWDGREPDVEAQAKGPVTNPIEMAMPSPEAAVQVLRSIPGYKSLFEAAFPGESQPVTYDNMGTAIGAFERGLVTPGPLDAFMAGDLKALDARQQKGLSSFLARGCASCHLGPALGGTLYRKIGLINAYETADKGRIEVTGAEVDLYVFKVPSLRNIAKTGPYFHDGSVKKLSDAVRLMGHHQLGIELTKAELGDIVAFLESLTGKVDTRYVARPKLPASGPDTPKPDPS